MNLNLKLDSFRKQLRRRVKLQAQNARLSAKLIDFGICVLLCFFVKYIGVLLASLYILFADSLNEGQSFGKKIIGFKVLSLEDLSSCSIKQSAIRNLPLSLSIFLIYFGQSGMISSFILFALYSSYEGYIIFKGDTPYRFGDLIANTTVIANDPNSEIHKRPIDLNAIMSSEFSGIVH